MSDTSTQATPIAVFLSGGGRSLANLIEHREQHGLPIDIRLVLSSSSKVRGVTVAREANLTTKVVLKSNHPNPDDYCQAMFDPCREAGVEWVVMAGFLKHVLIPEDFEGRVINIHPSLLPSFGGPGMYGGRVHQAAVDRKVKISGCTVHFVDNEYDNGPIILQRACEVTEQDTAETLAAKVFELECQALPDAIRTVIGQTATGGA
ncbi:MAG: phosphoribosylglycinamide formyltransferase [Rubripirellula sp.]